MEVSQIEQFLDWLEEHTDVQLLEEEWDYDYGGTFHQVDKNTLIALYQEHIRKGLMVC